MFIGKTGVKLNPEKVYELQEWPRQKWATDVGTFFELLQLFYRFIPNFVKIVTSLADLTKKDLEFITGMKSMTKRFKDRAAIIQASVLIALDWSEKSR